MGTQTSGGGEAPAGRPADGGVDLGTAGERIDGLVEQLAGSAVPPVAESRVRSQAEELVRVVADLYGAGLERLLEIAHESGRLDDELLARLADDGLVSSLLLVHGLHPYDLATRVERALASVRPYLGSHGGDVELLSIDAAGVVSLRLLGSCDGCPSSSVTLQLAVQDAIEAAAPEVTSIEVATAAETAGLIPVSALRTRLDAGASGASAGTTWHPLTAAPTLASGDATTTEVGGDTLFVCRVGPELYAFRDACAGCHRSLAGAVPVRRLGGAAGDAVLTCPACGLHYDVRRAGGCLDDAALHLDPLPLRSDGAATAVALPVPGPLPVPT